MVFQHAQSTMSRYRNGVRVTPCLEYFQSAPTYTHTVPTDLETTTNINEKKKDDNTVWTRKIDCYRRRGPRINFFFFGGGAAVAISFRKKQLGTNK